jgi:hypothetical protein
MFERALQIAQSQMAPDHPTVIVYTLNLARIRIERGRGASTDADLRRALETRERLYPSGDWRIAQAQSLLGAALIAQARYSEAEPLLLAADAALNPIPGQQGAERDDNRARLAALYRATGRTAVAATSR